MRKIMLLILVALSLQLFAEQKWKTGKVGQYGIADDGMGKLLYYFYIAEDEDFYFSDTLVENGDNRKIIFSMLSIAVMNDLYVNFKYDTTTRVVSRFKVIN